MNNHNHNNSTTSLLSSFHSIPFTTRIILLTCIITYLCQSIFTISIPSYSFNFYNIIFLHESYRCWTSTFLHGNFLHLFMNMSSLISLGGILESSSYHHYGGGGSLPFLLVILWSIIWTNFIQLLLIVLLVYIPWMIQSFFFYFLNYIFFLSHHHPLFDNILHMKEDTVPIITNLTTSTTWIYQQLISQQEEQQKNLNHPYIPSWDPYHLITTSSIGFSGILFHLLVLEVHSSSQTRSFYGLFHLSPIFYPWALLLMIQVLLPNVSFLGHVSGILAGYVQLYWKQQQQTTNGITSSSSSIAFYLPSTLYLYSFEQEYIIPWIYPQSNTNTTSSSIGRWKYIPMQSLPTTWNPHTSTYPSSSSSWRSCLVTIYTTIQRVCIFTSQQVSMYCTRMGRYTWRILFGSPWIHDPHLDLSSSSSSSSSNSPHPLGSTNLFVAEDDEEEEEWIGIPPNTSARSSPMNHLFSKNDSKHNKNKTVSPTRHDDITWI